jgi:thiamine-monophosphate kinase
MALSEDDLIARYFAPLAGEGAFGLRDDAAQISPPTGYDLVLTKDLLVSDGHFFACDPPFDIARKLIRVNLSDLAAKGAVPFGFLLGLALPQDVSEDWLADFAAGLSQDSRAYHFQLLGGDTVKGSLTLSLTALGLVPKGRMVKRFGAQAGNRLYVTGTIGDAALGLKIRLAAGEDQGWIAALSPAARDFLLERYLLPQPRVGLADAMQAYAQSGMDISDGFIGDLRKMMRVSRVSALVHLADVPFSSAASEAIRYAPHLLTTALTGGDDYELLATVAPEQCVEFEAAARDIGVALTRIGDVTHAGESLFIGRDGVAHPFDKASFSHF